jgi:hypothetical protein
MSTMPHAPSLDISAPGFDIASDENECAFMEVRHAAKWAGLRRQFEVFVDDRCVGSVGRNTPGRFRVDPGRHTVAARMDWVSTQTVFIHLDGQEYVVFFCGMDRFHTRVWSVAVIIVGVLFCATLITLPVGRFFPGIDPMNRPVYLSVSLASLAIIVVCELIIFSKMMPWSSPGSLFRLFRQPVELGPPE